MSNLGTQHVDIENDRLVESGETLCMLERTACLFLFAQRKLFKVIAVIIPNSSITVQYSFLIPTLPCSLSLPMELPLSACCLLGFRGSDATHWLLNNDPERPSFSLIPT